MTNLSDTQRILLSTAAQRATGTIIPLPPVLKPGGGTSKAIAALIKRGFAAKRETPDQTAVYHRKSDVGFGVFITPAGGAAIGIDLADKTLTEAGSASGPEPMAVSAPTTPRPSRKAATVIALLTRADGATLPDLITATGWLPHTTRAALTGLRKKGHAITRGKREGVTCYRIVEAA